MRKQGVMSGRMLDDWKHFTWNRILCTVLTMTLFAEEAVCHHLDILPKTKYWPGELTWGVPSLSLELFDPKGVTVGGTT